MTIVFLQTVCWMQEFGKGSCVPLFFYFWKLNTFHRKIKKETHRHIAWPHPVNRFWETHSSQKLYRVMADNILHCIFLLQQCNQSLWCNLQLKNTHTILAMEPVHKEGSWTPKIRQNHFQQRQKTFLQESYERRTCNQWDWMFLSPTMRVVLHAQNAFRKKLVQFKNFLAKHSSSGPLWGRRKLTEIAISLENWVHQRQIVPRNETNVVYLPHKHWFCRSLPLDIQATQHQGYIHLQGKTKEKYHNTAKINSGWSKEAPLGQCSPQTWMFS